MSILSYIFLCVGLGLIVWLIQKYTPLAPPIKTLILVAVIIVLVLVLLQALGVGTFDMQIPRLR